MNLDIIYSIFQFLEPCDLIKCSQVCTTFYKVSKMDLLWKPLLKETFYNVTVNKHFYDNYKKYHKLNEFLLLQQGTYYDSTCKYQKVNNILRSRSVVVRKVPIPKLLPEIELLVHINNLLEVFPHEICCLTNLNWLNISYNKLEFIPESISLLIHLTELNLTSNKLQIIPSEIRSLTNLNTLILQNNKLQNIPELNQLSKITYLDLCDNCMSRIPKGIEQLVNLEEMYLYNNELTIIPMELEQLSQLGYLSIYGNELESIQIDFRKMTNLIELRIDNDNRHLLVEKENLTFRISYDRHEEPIRMKIGMGSFSDTFQLSFLLDEEDW